MIDYPILHPESHDYHIGSEYKTEHQNESENRIIVSHEIQGKNLVSRLLANGDAQFAIEVSSPYSIYRRIELAKPIGEVTFRQKIEWNSDEVCSPCYIRPLVLVNAETSVEHRLCSTLDSVNALWHGRNIRLSPSSIIAHNGFFVSTSGLSIVRLVPDSEATIPEGGYSVRPVETEGYYFRVVMHESLFKSCQQVNSPASFNHLNSMLTGALACGLSKIHLEFGYGGSNGRDWMEFPNLRELHRVIKEHGLPNWDEEDFDPALTATTLTPIVFAPSLDHD